jgi:hypothetical protein
MSALNEPVAKHIGDLIRMLSSTHDGEILATVAAMKRLFKAEDLDFHDIATVIESCNGAIEERKYSDADAEIIFARGVERGRAEQQQQDALPPEFYDADGQPRWNEIALFCQRNNARLRSDWEKTFVADMAGNTVWRQPTEKQAKHPLAIFVKFGGSYDPKTARIHS